MVKQISLDTWSVQHLADLLRKGSLVVAKTNTPLVLYRHTLEEEDNSYEETVCTLTRNYVIEQLVTSGGVIAPSFNQQLVFTLDEFPDRLLRKSKDLFLQVVETLENQIE